MIDAESEIFSKIAADVRAEYPGIYLTGEHVKSPPEFPCASLVEIDNSTFRNSQTTDLRENHAVLMYELNVYSNKTNGKKSECRAIAACIDELLQRLGFTRTMLQPVPNEADATIYRMLGRYRAVISKNHTIYRR